MAHLFFGVLILVKYLLLGALCLYSVGAFSLEAPDIREDDQLQNQELVIKQLENIKKSIKLTKTQQESV